MFPGGVSESTDFSPDWLDLIGHKDLPLKTSMKNASFYQSYINQLPKEALPAHIGFRICAIRETFEESGVLLVRSLKDGDMAGCTPGLVSNLLSEDDIKSWRSKVHSDSSLFIQLCRLNVVVFDQNKINKLFHSTVNP